MADPLGALGDWIMWLLGGIGSLLVLVGVPVGRDYRQTRKRSIDNKRRLEGDDHSDGYEGLMTIGRDTRQRVALLEEKIDQARRERKHEHEAVMDEIESLRSDG